MDGAVLYRVGATLVTLFLAFGSQAALAFGEKCDADSDGLITVTDGAVGRNGAAFVAGRCDSARVACRDDARFGSISTAARLIDRGGAGQGRPGMTQARSGDHHQRFDLGANVQHDVR